MWLLSWPTFEERYVGCTVVPTPGYWESLITVLLLLLAVTAGIYALLGRKRRALALQLVTLRPSNIRSVGEHSPGPMVLLVAVLQGAVLVGILYTLLAMQSTGGGPGVRAFWTMVGVHSGQVLGLFLASLILQIWLGYSFGEDAELKLWVTSYVLLSVMWSTAQILPLLLVLFLPGSRTLLLVVMAGLYIGYRMWVVWRGMAVISRVRRHPLHIIWYLCGCELLPLLYLSNAMMEW